jgi:2',3'-cyclic-nucleotide 2'-phosphodiesterase
LAKSKGKTMNILYVGDVQGEPGIKVVERVLSDLRKKHDIDLVIAQAENLSDGRGIRVNDFERLKAAGVDFCTGGNWTLHRDEIFKQLSDPKEPIIRPANYPSGTPGLGYKTIATPKGKVLVISLLGHIVGKDADKPVDNPLKVVDRILADHVDDGRIATVVNFHGDFSSEKRIIGYYLDGRATLVVGDHWHVPTADAMLLPKGTAHITDVGMCGSLDSSLGINLDVVIYRWRDGLRTPNTLETKGRMQFNAVLVATNTTGTPERIEQVQEVFDEL